MVLAAFIISITALVVAIMALPTVAQMIWGKPHLTIEFGFKDVEGGRVMICELFNAPISQGFKKIIGVRRMTIEDMLADFSINEYGTNKVIHPGIVPYISREGAFTNAQIINLPASIFPAFFRIAGVNYNTKNVILFEGDIKLPIGKYIVKVNVQFQENESKADCTLIVCGEFPYAYWDK